MYGLAIEKLKEWKNKEDRKSIILMGGKTSRTWIMKEFGKTNMRKSHIYHFIVQSKNTRDFSNEMN
ncbi:hypothetical protein [Holdemanella biformis]|uniref:hypothetical protein n=1 Tax=Holdemanella biformis TaxID=1735 RepID=UPI0026737AF7|nr:hypothetical protein [Holdemanella biformis]